MSNAFAERTHAPLAGVILVMALAATLATWTVRRIVVAEAAQARVEHTKAPPAATSAARTNVLPEVRLVRPVKTVWTPNLEIEGTLAPQQTVSLAFPLAGKLTWLRAKLGDRVAAGARLAGLDTSQADMQAAATAAQVRAAAAQWELANDNVTRIAALVAHGAHSLAGATQSSLQATMASAQLEASRAQYALAQVSLRDHTLYAPFAGTVVEAPDGIGIVVNPGQTLFRLAALKTLKLGATLTETDANLLRVGSKVVIETERGQVEGHISALLAALEERTRRVPVLAEFENPGSLRAGALVRARVESEAPIDVLRLPRDALRPGSQNEVLVLVPGSPATLAVHQIAYVTDTAGGLLVRSGLAADDAVVIKPGAEVNTGDSVSIAAPSTETRPQ